MSVEQVEIKDIEANVVKEDETISSKLGENGFTKLDNARSQRVSQDIAWSGLNFKVKNKSILEDCYGKVPAGQVCAIMGPSVS